MGRVFEFLDEEEMEDESQKPSIGNTKGSWTCALWAGSPDKTTFMTYSWSEAWAKVAIVNRQVLGKTAMVNLWMRFYDIFAGKIAIDGVDTKAMSREGSWCSFRWSYKIPGLEGTIRENLAFNQTDISD